MTCIIWKSSKILPMISINKGTRLRRKHHLTNNWTSSLSLSNRPSLFLTLKIFYFITNFVIRVSIYKHVIYKERVLTNYILADNHTNLKLRQQICGMSAIITSSLNSQFNILFNGNMTLQIKHDLCMILNILNKVRCSYCTQT